MRFAETGIIIIALGIVPTIKISGNQGAGPGAEVFDDIGILPGGIEI